MGKATCANCTNRVDIAVCRDGLANGGICDDHSSLGHLHSPAPVPRRANYHGQHMVVLAEGHEARAEHAFQRARGKASTPQWLLAHLDRTREETRTLRKYCQDVLAGSP